MVSLFRKKSFYLLVVLFYLLVIGGKISLSYAEDVTPTPTPTQNDNSDKTNKLQSEINDLQSQIAKLQAQETSLANQIGIMDNQIKLTELRINATEEQIKNLENDIQTASKKITSLETSLREITEILLTRIVATYQVGKIDPLQILLTSDSISDAITRADYLRVVQIHDKKLIYATQQARNDYANQKTIFESKKAKVESLQKQLEDYTKQLDLEKQEKEDLLAVTKNSEKEYQKRLTDALKELKQISSAAKILASSTPKHVGRGEVIGIMGNTGYSFGKHLHFGLYNVALLDQYNYYSNHENPADVLSSQSVDWGTGCSGDPTGQTNTGSGSFQWPMSTGNLHITQGYGHTCYSDVYYKGNPHPAFDMYNNDDTVVRAADEGQAYFCRNCTGDGANGVFIFHSNGKMTLYWHLQ